MVRGIRFRIGLALGVLSAMAGPRAEARGPDGPEVPAAFAPFEHLVNGWHGSARPAENPIKGWVEEHEWAWTFDKGEPTGLALAIKGREGSVVSKARLSYDPDARRYRLAGTDPEGRPVAFAGPFRDGRMLALDREGDSPRGRERLTIRVLPDNPYQYAMWLEVKGPGSPSYSKALDVVLTRNDAARAGGAAEGQPKCIITGGTATLSVSYNGKSYPVCCSGCQEEFKDDPERYIKKAALREARAAKAPKPSQPAGLRKDDGAFDGLVDAPPKPRARPTKPPAAPKAEPDAKPDGPGGPDKGATARAAALLRLGQALEKSGKKAGAISYYREIVKTYPETPQARTAAGRIKALGGK